VSIVGKCTWESRGSKHIHVFGIEDKQHVTMVVTSSIVGVLLPLQIIFISTTSKTLPPNNQIRVMCVTNGWDLTYNENR